MLEFWHETKDRTFDVPTQVAFYNLYDEVSEDENDIDISFHYCGGIAYGNVIICGCCGGIINIDELFDECPANRVPLYKFDTWLDVSDEIIGR